MSVEWQGDHKLLRSEVKQDLERELTRRVQGSTTFLVEVRRDSDSQGASDANRYVIFITDMAHPEHETWTLRGGEDENWVAQLAKVRR